VALLLLAPQSGLFATVESKSDRNCISHELRTVRAVRTDTRQGILPEMSNCCYCHPATPGVLPAAFKIDLTIQPRSAAETSRFNLMPRNFGNQRCSKLAAGRLLATTMNNIHDTDHLMTNIHRR